jgi:hypothetical protein
MDELWPWLALAGLGAFHGLNPAMGWLFAVALGLHRRSTASVLMALPPIAIGHFLSVAVVALVFVVAGVTANEGVVRTGAGVLLIGWAGYHQLYGHRHRVRFGMTTRWTGLASWSFLMATAHGAGLMIVPALIPLHVSHSAAHGVAAGRSWSTAIAAVGLHSGMMLAVTAIIAYCVYRWIGLAILRSAWINLDLLWTVALAVTGIVLLLPW